MADDRSKRSELGPPTKISNGTWILFAILGVILVSCVIGFWFAFTHGQIPHISVHGWIAMSLGIAFSLVIGCGLMWLSFYSAKHGFDDRADPGRLRQHNDVNRP
jgi:protein-S-isoprenylcysteine O-methyltransferase Ste14